MSSSKRVATTLQALKKPEFLKAKQGDKDTLLQNAVSESVEVVWLRSIQNLRSQDLGIDDLVAHEKFKALMILQAHDIHLKRQSFNKTRMRILVDLIESRAGSLSVSADEDSIFIDATPLANIFKLMQELFLPIDSGLPKSIHSEHDSKQADSTGNFIDKLIAEPKFRGLLGSISFNRFMADLPSEMLKSSIQAQADMFNVVLLQQKIEEIKKKDINKLCKDCNLNAKETKISTEIHGEYLALYDQFIQAYNANVQSIQSIVPGFTAETFQACYNKAFEKLKQDITIFYHSFLLELSLQRYRKDNLHSELTELYDFLNDNDAILPRGVSPLNPDKLVELQEQNEQLPPSLHEIVAWSYSVLHTPNDKLSKVLASTTQQSSDTFEQKSNGVVVPVTHYSLNTMSLEKPLFPSLNETPGHISNTFKDKIIQRQKIAITKFAIFDQFSKEFAYDPAVDRRMTPDKTDHRRKAVEEFERSLEAKTESVEAVAALCDQAKPCINRHRHYIWDTITRKNNTETWRKGLKLARVKALGFLKNEVVTLKPEDAKKLLQDWRSDSLFSAHRNESKLQGAWGRTSAQREIDRMLAKVNKSIKGIS